MTITPLAQNRPLLSLTAVYLVIFLFQPLIRLQEPFGSLRLSLLLVFFVGIWWLSTKLTFSKTAYILMFIWLVLHTIGAKYTFAEVPDWFNSLIGSGAQ